MKFNWNMFMLLGISDIVFGIIFLITNNNLPYSITVFICGSVMFITGIFLINTNDKSDNINQKIRYYQRTCLECGSHDIENYYIFTPLTGQEDHFVCQKCGNRDMDKFR